MLLPCFPPPEQKGLDPPALPSQTASSSSKSDEISFFHITVPKPHGYGISGSSWMRSYHYGLKVSPSSVLSFPLQKPQMQSWQSLSHTLPSASEALGSQSATLDKSHCPQIPHKPRKMLPCENSPAEMAFLEFSVYFQVSAWHHANSYEQN